jgi:hypothetical protein
MTAVTWEDRNLEGGDSDIGVRHLPEDANENHEKPLCMSATKIRIHFLVNYTTVPSVT